MRATIDKSGRLVIPRGLRAQVGLIDGGDVDIGLQGAAIVIEPVSGEDLARHGGFVVVPESGELITDAYVREQRLLDQR